MPHEPMTAPSIGTDEERSAANMHGIAAMIASMFCFNTNDMLIKLASEDLPTGQIVFLRGLVATGLLALLAWRQGALRAVPEVGRKPFAWRAVSDALGTLVFLTALFQMSLATATAILQSLPIFLTIVSAVFLKETVRWRRWAAVLVGFGGVLMIIQPGGEGFNVYSLLAVASLGLIIVRDLSTRYIPKTVHTLTISVVGSFAVMVSGGVMSLFETWRPVSPGDALLLGGAALFLIGGYVSIVAAMRSGELSTVAPFRYAIILFALTYSYIFWGEIPNAVAMVGIFLVVASGIYVFHREGRAKRRG
ncbi:DMT family transporter [Lutibaculum baratangense]|uniref:EamA domain-containing protein n=1 Tax=Lutibaculum baratangense AMV1 TaxID=631454 RepID=V4R467_9HYPH|nr:DMT family transporter [Lutibaculum baratangense]ESR26752.1 protein of unknown function DUF6, transmembrane [Lutibaculum baratangense AMV1]